VGFDAVELPAWDRLVNCCAEFADNRAVGRVFQVRVHVAGSGQDALRFQGGDQTYYMMDSELRELQIGGSVVEVLRSISEEDLPVRFFLPHDGAVNDPPPESARLAVLARLLSEGRADGDVHIRFLGRNRSVPPDGFVLDCRGGSRRYVWQTVESDEARSRATLDDRFRALRHHFADPDRRVVLSLGSGGIKLFCHATALRLLERIGCGPHIEEVWGSSAGALVGLLYCHGMTPQAIEAAGYDLYSGRYKLPFHPSKLQLVRSLLRDAITPAASAAGFVDCAEGVSEMLSRYCDELHPKRPLYTAVFNLADCRPEILTQVPVPAHLADFIARADPRDAALASCAVPLLFVPRQVRRNGRTVPYIDGSTTEEVPLRSIVRKWDRDREAGVETRDKLTIFYVRLAAGTENMREDGARISKLRVLQLVASAGMETMYQRDVELLQQRPDVELIHLQLSGYGSDFFDRQRIPQFIRAAKESFPLQLQEIENTLRAR
jgi:predicted acylesterase/phospholipase RssA